MYYFFIVVINSLLMLLLRIISADGEIYNGNARRISLPTVTGMITILPSHMNLSTILGKGTITYHPISSDDTSLDEYVDVARNLAISGGIAMIDNDIVTITLD